MASITSSVKSRGCGLVNRTRSSPSISPQAAQQLAEGQPVAERRAVGVHVLPEQRHLDDAVVDQRRDLGQHVPGPAVLLLAAQAGHDAEGAGVVAADRDRDPGARRPTRAGRAAPTGILQRLDDLDLGLLAVAGPAPAGPAAAPMLWVPKTTSTQGARSMIAAAVLLGQAAAHRDLHAGGGVLGRQQVAEVAVQPVVGVLADRAGVEHEHVRGGAACRAQVARVLQQARRAARSRARSSGTRRCGSRRCEGRRLMTPYRVRARRGAFGLLSGRSPWRATRGPR